MAPEPNTPNDAGGEVRSGVSKRCAEERVRRDGSRSIALGFASALDTGYYDLVNEHRDVEFGKH